MEPDRRTNPDRRSRVDKMVDETLPQWREDLMAWQESVELKVRVGMLTLGAIVILMVAGSVVGFLAGRALQNEGVQQIQAERYHSLIVSCEDTNRRNTEAKREARRLGAQEVAAPLIEALAPARADCVGYANSRVNTRP